jgi:hypothetical protein
MRKYLIYLTLVEMTTRIEQIVNQATKIRDELIGARERILSFTVRSEETEERDVKDETRKYETLFEEEEAKLQALGGKTRKQTLQEFVLLFFWISYAVFTISVGLFTSRTQGTGAAQKIVGILVLVALVITAILIRYA